MSTKAGSTWPSRWRAASSRPAPHRRAGVAVAVQHLGRDGSVSGRGGGKARSSASRVAMASAEQRQRGTCAEGEPAKRLLRHCLHPVSPVSAVFCNGPPFSASSRARHGFPTLVSRTALAGGRNDDPFSAFPPVAAAGGLRRKKAKPVIPDLGSEAESVGNPCLNAENIRITSRQTLKPARSPMLYCAFHLHHAGGGAGRYCGRYMSSTLAAG